MPKPRLMLTAVKQYVDPPLKGVDKNFALWQQGTDGSSKSKKKHIFSLDFILLDVCLRFYNLLPFYLALVP